MLTRSRIAVLAALAAAFAPAAPTAVAAAAGPAPAPAAAAAALGNEGQLYQVLTGTLGELFPDDRSQPAGSAVLALDVVGPDGSRERTLVPGSEGPEVEGAPSVVFEDASRRLYAVWESKKTPTVSRLLLADFGAGGWSEPIEISGDIAPLKDEPRILVTRDRLTLRNPAGKRESRSRTTIHVLWREEAGAGAGAGIYYTPVILEGGRYLGWNPVVALGQLDLNPPGGTAAAAAADLLRAPELIAGRDLQSAVIGFLSPASGRLLTVEVRLLPGELGFLADDFRGQIIDIGARDREGIEALAERFRGQIIDIGRHLNGGVLGHFADRASSTLLELFDAGPGRPLEALADEFRGQIIDIGGSLLGGPGGYATAGAKLIEVAPPKSGQAAGPAAPRVNHLVRLKVVSDLPAPPLDGVTPARMFVSEDGERVLVGWASKGKVFYTESAEEAAPDTGPWAAVKHMTLTERLGILDAAAILEARVRHRR